MELAIPLIALGGMYIVSNQQPSKSCQPENKKKAENFTNMGIVSNLATKTSQLHGNYLPNTNIPPQNFPITNINQLVDTVQEYPNPNTATDKYFDQNLYENQVRKNEKVSKNPQQVYSLTGNYLDSAQFKHNNMVPFVGGKPKGYTYHANTAETLLDNMIGSGSQTIKKIEQAPLFKPESNIQWAYGMPNNSDFYQSRVNPGMNNNNVKPFDSVMVGPGLDKGYSINGTGGYNSGMEARDKWLPYTVDQLRVSTNPKLEYQLVNHEGPANSSIKNAATTQMIGRVEKQRPDTFFINTQDRWLTTTGLEKGETLRPIQEMGIIKRDDNVNEYVGPGNDSRKTSYVPSNFEQSKRQPTETCDLGVASAMGQGPITNSEYSSYKNYNNNRSSVKPVDSFRSGFSGAIGAVVAPLMDVLRPSRKDELVNNIRVYGDGGSSVPSSYVINTHDKTATTVKETTLYAPRGNINNQRESNHYVNTHVPLDLTQRDTTACSTMGFVGGLSTNEGMMIYDSNYAQTNNDIKSQTIYNRPNQGGTQIFNQQMNVNTYRDDSNRYDNRLYTPSSIVPLPAGKEQIGKFNTPQMYDESKIGCERISPDLLDAFRQNPYTHSLHNSA